MKLTIARIASLILLAPALSGCEGRPLSGPPDLRLGHDPCVECGMLISEDRCSSALLIHRDGRREHLLFDDIGCMLDIEREGIEGATVLQRFVHDHDSRQWLDADTATFLIADPDRLPTPMASGMVAYAGRAAAESAQRRFGGDVTDYAVLGARRREWLEARLRRVDPAGE